MNPTGKRAVITLCGALCAFGLSEASVAAQTTITFLTYQNLRYGKAMQTLVDEFNAEQNQIKVEIQWGSYSGDILQKFQAGYAAGSPPDVLWGLNTDPALFAKGMVLAVDPYLKSSPELAARRFLPGVSEGLTYDGKLYGMPFGVNLDYGVLYNRSLFAAAGLTPPRTGWTWDEFLQDAQRTTLDANGDQKSEQYGWGLWDWNAFEWISSAGGRIFDKNAAAGRHWFPDTDATVEALQFMYELMNVYRVQPLDGGAGGGGMFSDGTVAMVGEGSYAIPTVQANAPNLDFSSVAWPARARHDILVYPYALYLVNTGTAQTRAASWSFIQWMSRQDHEIKDAVIAGQVPAHLDAAASADYRGQVNRQTPQLLPLIDEAVDYGTPYPLVIGTDFVTKQMKSLFADAAAGKISPKAALQTLHEKVQAYYADIDTPLH
ncbi:MAG TPA: extracellular solute-binding protein [Limnochordia bacterium]|nr:extracellular solute-binding protein [Limnochordia bacterium]